MLDSDVLHNYLPRLFPGSVQVLMKDRLPRWERCICYVIVPVSLALSVVGIFSSIKELVHEFRQQ